MARALIVDDSNQNLYILEVMLKAHGYEVDTAQNGAEALVKAIANTPEVIISDILMPVMDGFTFCNHCKNTPQLQDLPFIFYTATYTDPKDESFALGLGADAFLIKPLDPLELMSRIEAVLAAHAQKAQNVNTALQAPPQIDLKEYNEILIQKLEKKMADLDATNHQLTESEARYRNLFERVPIGLYRTRIDGQILDANPALLKMLGYDSLEEIRRFNTLDGYHQPQERTRWQTLLERDELVSGFETQWRRRDGSLIWVEESARRIVDSSGNILYEGSVSDITQRKEAEEVIRNINVELENRVDERTAQLAATNEELESFSYSVSHDLRAPLRAMEGFSQILLEDYSGQLDPTGQSYLQRIAAASNHMKQLIDDLLKLSQVTRGDLLLARVNLSEMAVRICTALQESQPQRQVDWIIAPNVVVTGGQRLLEMALSNLFGNAFKFTARCTPARIEFGTLSMEGETVYYVRDNGIGFDMAYAARLFGAFQRLPSAQDFEGTGIGLTIVKRIVARHGGRVWAEGSKDQGAAFFFTLAT